MHGEVSGVLGSLSVLLLLGAAGVALGVATLCLSWWVAHADRRRPRVADRGPAARDRRVASERLGRL